MGVSFAFILILQPLPMYPLRGFRMSSSPSRFIPPTWILLLLSLVVPAPASGQIPQSTVDATTGDPVLTMAPHPEDNRYWVSGQANIIFQGRLPFHSLYQGPNSFRNSAEYKTSMVGTLFTALRPTHSIRYNTDFILDLESAGGRGLSEALGLAGEPNLDVVRNPNLGPTPYLGRYEIHQT